MNPYLKKTKEEDVPSAEIVASYVEALKLHLKDNKIKDNSLIEIIDSLPSAIQIKSDLSYQEIQVLFESVRYAWEKLTGQDILQNQKMETQPDTLEGNYWMIKNGILLEGPNHVTIIRKNMELLTTLLNIDPFVLHAKLSGHPDGLIKTVIDHGGVRIFVNKDKNFYCQLSDDTYSAWAGKKIRKYAFKSKIVKVIDKKQPYKGWKSGIVIKLK